MGLTKFCPHIVAWNPNVLDFIGCTKPAIIKVVGPFGHNTEYLKEAKRRSPDSKWLFRLYLDEQPLDNPLWNAQEFIEKLNPYLEFYKIFEDYNEIDPRDHSVDPPDPLNIETIKRYNLFSANVGSRLHAVGKQHLTGCWSNGQPPDGAWPYLKESLEIADYLSIHNYGWETLPDCPQFALRHREIFNLLPVKKLMILSEVGMTNAVFGGPDLGWRSWKMPPNLFAKERRAAAVWAWFLDRINEDPYVVATNVYTTGRLKGDNWGTHDFTPRLYKLVGDYILGHPSPDPYLPNGGNNMSLPEWIIDLRGTLKKHPTKKYATRSLSEIDTIVVHHTGTPLATPEAIANWHVNHHDWPGAGYHIYIRKNGKVYLMNSLETISYHTSGHNFHTLALAFEGDFTKDTVQEIQIGLGQDVVQWIEKHLGTLTLLGHKYIPGQATACPGHFPTGKLRSGSPPPIPNWEAKYNTLRGRANEVKGLLIQIQEDIDGMINDDFRDLSRMREAIERLLE